MLFCRKEFLVWRWHFILSVPKKQTNFSSTPLFGPLPDVSSTRLWTAPLLEPPMLHIGIRAEMQSARYSTFPSQIPRRSADPTCRKLLGLKRRYLRLARSYCSKEMWLFYKQTACKLMRHIKSTSRNYWDKICCSQRSNGQIFKLLKNLARKDSPLGDNILWSGDPVASWSNQRTSSLQLSAKVTLSFPSVRP